MSEISSTETSTATSNAKGSNAKAEPLSALEAHLAKKEKLDEKSLVYRTFYRTLGQGLEMGMSVAVGIVLGIFIDKQFATAPWGLLWCSFAGLVASILSARRLMKTSQEIAKKGPKARNLYEEDDCS